MMMKNKIYLKNASKCPELCFLKLFGYRVDKGVKHV
jgi:hypothetical protein